MEERAGAKVIKAHVPLSEMFGYATQVRSMSQGRASYTMQFLAYEPAPKTMADEVIAKSAGHDTTNLNRIDRTTQRSPTQELETNKQEVLRWLKRNSIAASRT